MDVTHIARKLLASRADAMERAASDAMQSQSDTLLRLLRCARRTRVGRAHDFASIHSVEQFRRRVALRPYEAIRADVMAMVGGEANVLWPGVTRRFAQSSGTSDGRSKYVPITDRSLRLMHYRGTTDVVARYLQLHPDSRLFSARSFILGGSFATALTGLPRRVKVGDLSAHLIERIPALVNLVRIPSKRVALLEDWSRKLPLLVRRAVEVDVSNISGVPSWFLTVLKETMHRAGVSELHELWPSLEVFFHGGIAFGPYRDEYDAIIDPTRMRYMETYNASEGFFALQDDPTSHAMLLLMDVDTFYEFDPLDGSEPLTVEQVRQGEVYGLIITASNGLWRYPLGDTVRIESTRPLRITIAGRTKCFINAFGEELMVHNADAALAEACREHGCTVADYTVAPVFTQGNNKGRHQWLVEFDTAPANLEAFTATLDSRLCLENSDYAAKRSGGIFLAPPQVTSAPHGLFQRWLASTGKLGGQRKVPRLANDRHIIDPMLRMLSGE